MVERFYAAVAAVLELHRPVDERSHDGRVWQVCAHCWTGNPFCTTSASWPCPTVEALAAHVDVDGPRGGQ